MAATSPAPGFYSMGEHTMPVPMALFATNRVRLSRALSGKAPVNSLVLLQGGQEQGLCQGDSADVNAIFRQEAFFHWAFGVLEPDFFGCVHVDTGKSILFMPRLPKDYAVWMGRIETLDECKDRYQVHEVCYVDQLPDRLSKFGDPVLLTLNGVNSDSGKATLCASFDGISRFRTDKDLLYPVICELRVKKTDLELDVLRYVCRVSSMAHKHVMRMVKPGIKEYQCESEFLNFCYKEGGCRNVSYTCICGSGHNGSVLHYGHAGAPNAKNLEASDMVLFDMGGNYYGYCSDITCSYPVSGKFSQKQKVIYEAVLRASKAVLAALKPGVSWTEMHLLANREMLTDLKEAGLLKGSLDQMMAVNLAGRLFQPHGLGHFMGADVHDVGGYLDGHPPRPQGPGLQNLRTARLMEPGMTITVEPGCYFIDHLLDAALADPELSEFLVPEQIEAYRGFGGVRIEDNVAITESGCEVMSMVPRSVQDIQDWMAGQQPETIILRPN